MKYLVIIITAILVSFQASGQEMIPLKNIQPIASNSLLTFQKLVTKQNYRIMGFEKFGEVKDAYLGDPIQVFMVRLDKLQEYEPGDDPLKLLSNCESIIYPLLVNDQVRSSIEIEKINETWKPSQFGGENLAKMLTKTRTQISGSTKIDITLFFAVLVPALNLHFIAHKTNNLMMLTPVIENQGFDFKSGIPISADKVFEIILPAAKAHDGLPG